MNQVEINGGQLSSVLNRKLRITTNEVCELLSIKRDKLRGGSGNLNNTYK